MKKPEIKYQKSDIEEVFQKLISNWKELTECYNEEMESNYERSDKRLPYIDISVISRFIVAKKKSRQTENFERFFKNVEEILIHGDHYVRSCLKLRKNCNMR